MDDFVSAFLFVVVFRFSSGGAIMIKTSFILEKRLLKLKLGMGF